MSLKTIIKKWLDGDNSAAQQQNIIDVLNKQQQAILQQFAQMQRPEPQAAPASEAQEVATLKQQLSVAQEQIRELQSQLANAKNQGVKDFLKASISAFIDLYRFAKALRLLANVGVGMTLKFIEQLIH